MDMKELEREATMAALRETVAVVSVLGGIIYCVGGPLIVAMYRAGLLSM